MKARTVTTTAWVSLASLEVGMLWPDLLWPKVLVGLLAAAFFIVWLKWPWFARRPLGNLRRKLAIEIQDVVVEAHSQRVHMTLRLLSYGGRDISVTSFGANKVKLNADTVADGLTPRCLKAPHLPMIVKGCTTELAIYFTITTAQLDELEQQRTNCSQASWELECSSWQLDSFWGITYWNPNVEVFRAVPRIGYKSGGTTIIQTTSLEPPNA